MSWKAEFVDDGSDVWSSNAMRFPTEEQARGYARNLFLRWSSVRDWRIVESDDAVNAAYDLSQDTIDLSTKERTR